MSNKKATDSNGFHKSDIQKYDYDHVIICQYCNKKVPRPIGVRTVGEWKKRKYCDNNCFHASYSYSNDKERKKALRRKEQTQRDNLSNKYIKRLISDELGLKRSEIPNDIIKNKRAIIALKRQIKQ